MKIEQEKQIIDLVSQGLTNSQIGKKLSYSEHTIKMKISDLIKKYKVKNRVQLAFLLFDGTVKL